MFKASFKIHCCFLGELGLPKDFTYIFYLFFLNAKEKLLNLFTKFFFPKVPLG